MNGKTFYLANRWKIQKNKIIHYGLRQGKSSVKLNKVQLKILSSLPRELTEKERCKIAPLVELGAVNENVAAPLPKSLDEAHFCVNCCANDFIIPGIEFDESGLCPICASKHKTKDLKSVVPLIDNIPHSKKSRFDVALFYTGGKDSTYLLYYLSKVKKLKVLALTWIIPYASESALKSIENARRTFDSVEFVTRSVNNDELKKIYKELYKLNGNTCACPSLAYVLFYPTLVNERVPYFVAGNEPAQMAGLYYNGMAPEIAYKFWQSRFLNFCVNLGRILTLRPPLKRGQFHTLTTMSQLSNGTKKIVKLVGYENELVENVTKAIHTVPEIVKPLKRSLRFSSMTGRIPAFVQLDFDKICGGKYDWEKVKNILVEECGWVAPDDSGKGLHT
ncbi:MAG: hypothetical protein K2K80_05025, partial [Clostridia bacterium]|nr:hypothetical protein [Clostridia bacterium]